VGVRKLDVHLWKVNLYRAYIYRLLLLRLAWVLPLCLVSLWLNWDLLQRPTVLASDQQKSGYLHRVSSEQGLL